jgi:hypothetical protein
MIMDADETHGMEYGEKDPPDEVWYLEPCFFCGEPIEEDGEELDKNFVFAHFKCLKD